MEANKAGIDALVHELTESYGAHRVLGHVADVTKSDQVQGLIDASVSHLGALTVMVANAGIVEVKPILQVTEEEVRRVFDVNFMGVWNCYTLAAKQMIKQGPLPEGSSGYKIIGAASVVAFKPFKLLGPYSASKWAVRGLTQVMAMELSPHGISVNAYAPGIVGTKMWEEIDEKLGHLEGRQKGESLEHYVQSMTALGRTSVPDDVGMAVGGFLCGPDSQFVTGQTLIVDGGIVFS